jgi:hypothetical protein
MAAQYWMLSEAYTKPNPTRDKSLLPPDPVRRAVRLIRTGGSAFPHCLYLQKVLQDLLRRLGCEPIAVRL